MIPQKAMIIIENGRVWEDEKGLLHNYPLEDEYIEASSMAISALQKQIPIKPIQKESGWYYCPTCDTKVPVSNNFCAGYYRDKIGCGQKLDWRDEE